MTDAHEKEMEVQATRARQADSLEDHPFTSGEEAVKLEKIRLAGKAAYDAALAAGKTKEEALEAESKAKKAQLNKGGRRRRRRSGKTAMKTAGRHRRGHRAGKKTAKRRY